MDKFLSIPLEFNQTSKMNSPELKLHCHPHPFEVVLIDKVALFCDGSLSSAPPIFEENRIFVAKIFKIQTRKTMNFLSLDRVNLGFALGLGLVQLKQPDNAEKSGREVIEEFQRDFIQSSFFYFCSKLRKTRGCFLVESNSFGSDLVSYEAHPNKCHGDSVYFCVKSKGEMIPMVELSRVATIVKKKCLVVLLEENQKETSPSERKFEMLEIKRFFN